MLIDIKSLDNRFKFDYDASEISKDLVPDIVSNVDISGDITEAEDKVIVDATIDYDVQYTCARCLEPVVRHYSINLNEIFSSDGDENLIVDDKIDITEVVRELIVLNIDNRVLCKDDCKGLCPVCGTNLNINKCKCDKSIDDASGDNPFAVLKDITTGGSEDGSTKR